MTCVGFVILFGLGSVLYSCEGQVYPPFNQTVVLPGSNVTINWTYLGDPSKAYLFWYFTKRGSSNEQEIAVKNPFNPNGTINDNILPAIAIEDPATLILKNVDERYDGKYRFNVLVARGGGESSVEFFVAVTPNISVNCSNPTTVIGGDYIACECKGTDGNPPADVTWYKNDTKEESIDTGKEKAMLVFSNVDKDDKGTYICEAKSGIEEAKNTTSMKLIVYLTPKISVTCFSVTTVDEGDYFSCECKGTDGEPPADVTWYKGNTKIVTGKEIAKLVLSDVHRNDSGTYKCEAKSSERAKVVKFIEVIVNYRPTNVKIKLTWKDRSVTVTCAAKGRPDPSYEIFFRNKTVPVESNKTYTIPEVNSSHVGNYKCVAKNKLGNASSVPVHLSLVKPVVSVNCSNTKVNKGDYFVCQCNGTGGKPPADVTWYKNNTKIGSTGEEEKKLFLSNVDENDNGYYRCEAKSGIIKATSDLINLKVKPSLTDLPDPTDEQGGEGSDGPSIGVIVGIIIGVLAFIVIVVGVVYYFKKRERNGYKGNANVNPDDGGVVVNHYELEEDNAYDSVNTAGSSATTSKPPQDSLPPVYAAVDKNNREGKTLYATLDSVALQSDGSQKRKDDHPPPTEYADINFLKKEADQNPGKAV